MSNDTARQSQSEHDRDDDRSAIATLINGSLRLLVDLLVISLWVLFLTLLFLETAWPGWTFYALLVAGIGVYVSVTAAWVR
ncbi:hypothetical protein [Natrinema halophilum]|uniref:DUF8119 domain-containing protein n=1 Tax=Natrinema halophilum TaxID=1699371 RepID=A0A7D5KIX2_9EURY|nr:hypothetical protein [Natrinema halophilum]QLG47478.1 hypothetical protein HYG82_00760 [Natrinema halophilum]